MSTGRCAAIDIGTNTVLLVVAERRGDCFAAVLERAEITRLGRGVDRSGRLAAAAIRETVEVLARYQAEAQRLGARIVACVATSAARDAANSSEFFEAARRATGLTPEVIAGQEEARLVHGSAWRDFGRPGSLLAVLDVGGGSTEFTWGDDREPQGRVSLQIGAVRLTERVAAPDPVDEEGLERLRTGARQALAEIGWPGAAGDEPPPYRTGEKHESVPGRIGAEGARLVAVAGTVTTLAAVHQALPIYDAEKVHGSELTLPHLEALFTRLGTLTVAERARLPGMEPKRADVILAGCAIVVEALRVTGFHRLTVSDRGVRWGLLYERG
jgi:exopolyphosphatase / guanosine-5'-triphosphate,3'-diphosphate pyrophosphatase